MFDLIDHGHGYNWIVEGRAGSSISSCPIEPTLVTPKRLSPRCRTGRDSRPRTLRRARRADRPDARRSPRTRSSICAAPAGKGILEHARASLGTALATESYAGHDLRPRHAERRRHRRPRRARPRGRRSGWPSRSSPPPATGICRRCSSRAEVHAETRCRRKTSRCSCRASFRSTTSRGGSASRGSMLENSDPSFGNAEQFWQNFLTISMGGWLSLFEFARERSADPRAARSISRSSRGRRSRAAISRPAGPRTSPR